jgi:hypothetical protein
MSFLLQGTISHGRGEGGWGLDERDVYRIARSCGQMSRAQGHSLRDITRNIKMGGGGGYYPQDRN